jgi:nitrogen-specific signal transduction histidine kinase
MPSKSKAELLSLYLNTPPEEFIGLLVHDVRNPLSSVISAAKLMNVFLNESEPVNRDDLYGLIKIILRATDDIRLLLDVAVEYDNIQHSGITHDKP